MEKIFSQLRVDRLLLEHEDVERSGGFKVLRLVPQAMVVVLGIISTKVSALEPIDALRRRIDEACEYTSPTRVPGVQPAVRFRLGGTRELADWDDQRRKLDVVIETAERVWG